MVHQTVFSFKLGITREKLTAHGGFVLMAELSRWIGLRDLIYKYLRLPGGNRGYEPLVLLDPLVLMLQGGGSSFEDIRELTEERE